MGNLELVGGLPLQVEMYETTYETNQALLEKCSNAIGAPFRLQEQVMEMQDDSLMTLGARRDLSRYPWPYGGLLSHGGTPS